MNPSEPTLPSESGTHADFVDESARFIAALETLLQSGEWRPLPGGPKGAMLSRVWGDGTVDTLLILSPDTAYAWREDPNGVEIVKLRGTAEKMIKAAGGWGGPADPDAHDGTGH